MNNLTARTVTNYNNNGNINSEGSNLGSENELNLLFKGNKNFTYKINGRNGRNGRNNESKKKGILKKNNSTRKVKKEVFFHPIERQVRTIEPEGFSVPLRNNAKTITRRRLNIPVNFTQEKKYNQKELIAHLAAVVVNRHNSLQNSLRDIVLSDLDESMKKNLFNFVQRKYKGLVENNNNVYE